MAGEAPGQDYENRRGSEEKRSSEPPRYLAVAKLLKPWGLAGMVKAEILTDYPERFETPGVFFLGENYEPIQLESSRIIHGRILLKFAGYDSPEASGALRNQFLYIPTEDARLLGDEEYYIFEIIGLEVCSDAGERLGMVTDVWATGANDVYVVDWNGKTLLLPAISQVILDVNKEEGRMTVHLIDGLLP